MISRRDMPNVVMRFDGLRRSIGDSLQPQPSPHRNTAGSSTPYKAGMHKLRDSKDLGGSSTPRSQISGTKSRRLMRPSTGKRLSHLASSGTNEFASQPSFSSNVVGLSLDVRNQAIQGLGKETSLISGSELANQQSQVMQTCEMLFDIANMIAKAEQGRSTRVQGDNLKQALVQQQRTANTLKEQVASQQLYAHKVLAKNKELQVLLETANRRLKNAQRELRELRATEKLSTPRQHDETGRLSAVNGSSSPMTTSDEVNVSTSIEGRWELDGIGSSIGSPLQDEHSELPKSRQPQDPKLFEDAIIGLCAAAFWTWDFSRVNRLICSAIRVHDVRFIIRNHFTGGLVSSADTTIDGVVGSIGSLFRLAPQQSDATSSLAALTIEARSPITIPDIGADARVNERVDISPLDDAKTCVLSVPIFHEMVVQGQAQTVVIGVLQVAGKGRTSFDSRTQDYVVAIASFCARPLAVRLRNEEKILDFSATEKTVAEAVVAAVAGSYDIGLIAPILEQQIHQAIKCDAATILWINGMDPPLLNRVDGNEIILVPVQGLMARCIDSGEDINIEDVESCRGLMEECDLLPDLTRGSLLLIPVFGSNQKAVGILRLQSSSVRAFTSLEAHRVNSLRAIVTLGIGSLLHNSASAVSRRDFVQGLMQSDEQERPLHRMCQTLQSKIDAVLNGQAKDVNFYSVDDIQYEVCMIPYNESLQVREKKVTEVGNGLCGDTAASGAVSRVPNTCKDERFNLNSDLATITVSNMPSLWVPIRNLHGHIVGVVAVFVESDNAFDGGAGANVLRICHEIGPYFGDLIFIDALETERQRWREVTRQILTVFDNPEMDTCVEHVKAAFQRIFHLGRTQQWLFDASTANLTYTPAKGGGKDVTVSVNHPHPVCKCARSGTIWVIPPAYIEDNDVGARKDLYALPGSANEAQMIVPLMDSRNKPILIIQAERKHAFTSVEQEMMTEMSQIGALALEHARMLETESVPSVKQFEEALVLALTVEDAMREVIAACHKTCQCTNAVLFWPGPDGSMCQYYSEAGQVKMKTFVAAVGIASECLAEQKPMLLSDSRLHNRFHAGMDGLQYDQEERHDTHASAPEPIQAIYYPVVLKQSREPIAVICVREKKRGMAFNRQDLVSLGVLARKAAMTLRNVEKHEGLLEIARSRDLRHEQMANLNSIRIMQMEALASVSDHSPLNDIVKRMGNVICELLDVELCKLHVVEDGGKTLRMLGDSCFQDVVTDVTKAPESDIACRVLRDNETILFDLNSLGIEDPGVHLEVENVEMRDSLTVPLRGDAEQVFGVLQLVNKRGGSFTGSDELVIHMAASTFKTMLETYMLTEARFSIGLGNVESKPEEIAKIVLDKALHLMGVSVGQVLVLSDDQSKLKRYAAIMPSGERVGLSKRTFAAQRCEDENMYDATQGIAGHVLQTRATLNIPLLREESRFDAGIDLRNDFDGLHACLYCPMVTSSDDCIGVIQLVKASQGEFTEHKVRLLQVLAKQAGMMIWNRQRYESISRSSLQHVVDVTESVMWCLEVQPSIDLLVNRMTESVINIVPCENVVLLFCSRNGYKNHVWTKIANNTEDVWPFKKRTSRTAFSGKQPHTDVKIPLLNGILAEAIKTRKAVQAQRPDPQLTLDFEPLAVSEVKNILVTPIFRDSHDAVAGVLILVNKRENFVLEDSRKLEHYRSAIFPAVLCISRCEGWELTDFLQAVAS